MQIDEDVFLEHFDFEGMTDQEVDDFLEHFGVQGMKWGIRKASNKSTVAKLQRKGLSKRQAKNTNRYQNRVDAQRMMATGRRGKVSALKQLRNRTISNTMLSLSTVAKHPLSSKKAATLQLQKNQQAQVKIKNGEKQVTATLLRLQGISIKDINYKT